MAELECLRLRVAGEMLRLPPDCVFTAMTLYRRYIQRQHHDEQVLASCLFCATKLEEAECRTVDLVNVMRILSEDHCLDSVLQSSDPASNVHSVTKVLTGDDYYSEKAALIAAEHRLLRTIDFDVVVPRPQRELLMLCTKLNVSTSIVSVAVRLMNDMAACSNLFLKYESAAIAASVLYTAMVLMNERLDDGRRERWYEAMGFDVEVVEGLGHEIIDMLMDNQKQKSRRL